jgi:putative transposase
VALTGRRLRRSRLVASNVKWQRSGPASEDLLENVPCQPLGVHRGNGLLHYEAWTKAGLTRFLVLFVIDLATRQVEIAGIHHTPAEPQMLQWARDLSDPEDGFLACKQLLIHDRDPLFTKKFRQTLRGAGVRCLKMPKQSLNLNAYAESCVRNIKRECLSKMILFGERHVRHVAEQYVEHYNLERPHSDIDHHVPGQPEEPLPCDGPIVCHQQLDGLLKSYHRQAA